MEKIKIIIDCDPGHDDAIAILVAGNHQAIDLLALTTVAGNQTLNKTTVGPVHDVTCIAYLVAPELFTTQDMNVVVDINRGPCYGRTVCDTINCLKQPANCTVGTGIDLPRFWDLVAEAVAHYN